MKDRRNTTMAVFVNEAYQTIPFQKNFFASVFPGSLLFGKVVLRNGLLQYESDDIFTVDYQKLTEFYDLLEVLGKNLILEDEAEIEPEKKRMEVTDEEVIEVNNTVLLRKVKEEVKSEIVFHHFSYMHFVNAIKDIILFIINPDRKQYFVMLKIQKSLPLDFVDFDVMANVTNEEKDLNIHEMFRLEMFLRTHIALLQFSRKLATLA